MEKEKKMWKRWAVSMLCIALSLCPHQAAMAEGQDDYMELAEKRTEEERHEYGQPAWRWRLKGETTEATAVFICKRCREAYEKEAVVSFESERASCTEPGMRAYIAIVEISDADKKQAMFGNEMYIDLEDMTTEPAKGHDYGEPVWGGWSADSQQEPQITAAFTCKNDGCSETITKTVRGKEIGRKAPTCKEEGVISYQAQVGTGVPGETALSPVYEQKIPAAGHSYAITSSAWKWDAGKGVYYVDVAVACTMCGEKTSLSNLAEKSGEKKATCTEAGEITYTAKVKVGDVEYPVTTAVYQPPEGHTYGEPEWTWGEDYKTAAVVMACTRCAEGTEGHSIDARDEGTEVKIIKQADCTHAGKATYTASVELLGKTYEIEEEVVIPAAGHEMKKTAAKAATCKKAGNKKYYTCTACKRYFSDGQGKKEIVKGSWAVKKKAHRIESIVAKKPTKTKTGILTRRCRDCKTVEESITIPKTELVINIGDSAKVVKDPKKCKVSLKNEKKYRKYFRLDAKKGTVKTIKDYSVKFAKLIPLTVKIADQTFKVNVKIKIPAPNVEISRRKDGKYYRFTFAYNIEGADRIQVRCNWKNANVDVLDRYLSNPKSDSSSYIHFRMAENEKVTFTIRAYYGKNVSETRKISL